MSRTVPKGAAQLERIIQAFNPSMKDTRTYVESCYNAIEILLLNLRPKKCLLFHKPSNYGQLAYSKEFNSVSSLEINFICSTEIGKAITGLWTEAQCVFLGILGDIDFNAIFFDIEPSVKFAIAEDEHIIQFTATLYLYKLTPQEQLDALIESLTLVKDSGNKREIALRMAYHNSSLV